MEYDSRALTWAEACQLHVDKQSIAILNHEVNLDDVDITTAIVHCGHGQMNVVKRLHEMGCEFDDTCATYASGSGRIEILDYLHDVVKLPFKDPWIRVVAIREKQPAVEEWLNRYNLVMISDAVIATFLSC
jgi:hypothetical protein